MTAATVLIVCPNLAVDVTLEVEALSPGGVHRARSAHRQAGGKGVNAARALKNLGHEALVLGFAGGASGERIREGLRAENIASDLVPVSGESRTCTILLTPEGVATVVNELGPHVAPADVVQLTRKIETRLAHSSAVALMGSLAPGMPDHFYRENVSRARERGLLSLVDTSGTALAEALAARPAIAKPNRAEAEALLSEQIDTPERYVSAVRRLLERGAETAILTLGEEGVLVASADLTARCRAGSPHSLALGNPTGAGDALAAGLLAGRLRGYDLLESARLGVAAATASLAEGYGRFRERDLRVESVRVEILSRA